MTNKTILVSLIAIVLLTSCATVVSKHPVGISKYNISTNDWNGTWLSHNGIINIKVIDKNNGIIQLALIEYKNDKFKLETVTIQILKGKQWLYANILEMENKKANEEFFWGKIKKQENQIVFWLPSTESFTKAAESEKLHAIIDKSEPITNGREIVQEMGLGEVKLLDDPEKIIDLIENKGSSFFYWENPIVLIKLHD